MPTVLITGSGRRIGRGLALEFGQRGWDVIVHYHNSEESAAETVKKLISIGVRSYAVKADVRSSGEINNAFEDAVKHIGIPNVLVNNAGIYPKETSLTDISDELWDDVLGTNLSGEFYFARVFARHAKPGSRIVNIASLGALEIWRKRIPNNVSKAAILQLTKALSRELAPNTTVNCVCPGKIVMPEEPDEEFNGIPTERIPMKRFGTIKDIFDAVYFFATASDFITGQVLTVDGGYHYSR